MLSITNTDVCARFLCLEASAIELKLGLNSRSVTVFGNLNKGHKILQPFETSLRQKSATWQIDT